MGRFRLQHRGSTPRRNRLALQAVQRFGGQFTLSVFPFPGNHPFRGEHGRGGQARVLVAFDQNVGREIAWKELHGERTTGSSAGSASRK